MLPSHIRTHEKNMLLRPHLEDSGQPSHHSVFHLIGLLQGLWAALPKLPGYPEVPGITLEASEIWTKEFLRLQETEELRGWRQREESIPHPKSRVPQTLLDPECSLATSTRVKWL